MAENPAAPAVILVRPQMPENIGAAARAMANFGLCELRIVNPREAFPNEVALANAAGAKHVIENARLFASVEEAVADLTLTYATTARERGQAKRVESPEQAALALLERIGAGERVGVLFGPERTGLENDEVALAERVLTFPVDPAYASVNLAQAVLLVGYEWFKRAGAGLPFDMPRRSPPAEAEHKLAFFAHLEGALDAAGFFRPEGKRPVMVRNLRNIIHRMEPSQQDLRTLHGVVDALVEPRQPGTRRGRRVLGKPDSA